MTRSQLRVFILCGIAELPTCPGAKPSVTSSCPAIRRMVCASDDGPAPSCTNADTTSWSSERGYTWPTLVRVVEKPRKPATRSSSSASLTTSPLNRSSMSCPVPIGPLIPRSGYRSRSSRNRVSASRVSSAADANRLPNVVACAATLWLRPAITTSRYSTA
ncbi:Uncharacterised protein [Mycobacteroides abscessus subsp. abscessus]|nr:Uncharacterised protein [Mycobacteroides abscessus subsp. abscessus]